MRWVALLPLLGSLGACLTGLAPGIRVVDHHADLSSATPNAICMGCHEAEREVVAMMASMTPVARERAMHARMQGQGASLVAQWMIDDPRSCATCHRPRGGR